MPRCRTVRSPRSLTLCVMCHPRYQCLVPHACLLPHACYPHILGTNACRVCVLSGCANSMLRPIRNPAQQSGMLAQHSPQQQMGLAAQMGQSAQHTALPVAAQGVATANPRSSMLAAHQNAGVSAHSTHDNAEPVVRQLRHCFYRFEPFCLRALLSYIPSRTRHVACPP